MGVIGLHVSLNIFPQLQSINYRYFFTWLLSEKVLKLSWDAEFYPSLAMQLMRLQLQMRLLHFCSDFADPEKTTGPPVWQRHRITEDHQSLPRSYWLPSKQCRQQPLVLVPATTREPVGAPCTVTRWTEERLHSKKNTSIMELTVRNGYNSSLIPSWPNNKCIISLNSHIFPVTFLLLLSGKIYLIITIARNTEINFSF